MVTDREPSRRARDRLRRIEEIEADVADSDDAVGELLLWARDDDSTVRGHAYRALADHWEDPRPLGFLLAALKVEKDEEARGLTCIGLGRFLDTASDEGALEPDFEPDAYTADVMRDGRTTGDVYRVILRIAENKDEPLEVRRRALESLGSFAYRADIASLVEEHYQSGSEPALISALFAMGRSGLKRYRKRLLRHLEDARPPVQFEAIQAVEWWEMRAALPHLRRIAIDRENPNRGEALAAFAHYAPTAQIRQLFREVRELLPDELIASVMPDIEEQLLDDLEIGAREEDDLTDLFGEDD